ncbi:MAG: FHA domain-containing protein [Limisphaerales bacterium]
MIQFNILSGKNAGTSMVARHFPFRIGRAASNELSLDENGIWDQHLTIEFDRKEGFTLAVASNALTAINDQPLQAAQLRNGDIITLGSVKLQFWLTAVHQRGLRMREGFF